MSEFYDGMAETASEMIDEFGMDFTLQRVRAGEYVPGAGTGAVTPTNWTGRAIRRFYSLRMVDGTNIRASDFRLLVSVTNMEQPKPGDRCKLAGIWLNVIDAKPIAPSDRVLCYEVQARA